MNERHVITVLRELAARKAVKAPATGAGLKWPVLGMREIIHETADEYLREPSRANHQAKETVRKVPTITNTVRDASERKRRRIQR